MQNFIYKDISIYIMWEIFKCAIYTIEYLKVTKLIIILLTKRIVII